MSVYLKWIYEKQMERGESKKMTKRTSFIGDVPDTVQRLMCLFLTLRDTYRSLGGGGGGRGGDGVNMSVYVVILFVTLCVCASTTTGYTRDGGVGYVRDGVPLFYRSTNTSRWESTRQVSMDLDVSPLWDVSDTEVGERELDVLEAFVMDMATHHVTVIYLQGLSGPFLSITRVRPRLLRALRSIRSTWQATRGREPIFDTCLCPPITFLTLWDSSIFHLRAVGYLPLVEASLSRGTPHFANSIGNMFQHSFTTQFIGDLSYSSFSAHDIAEYYLAQHPYFLRHGALVTIFHLVHYPSHPPFFSMNFRHELPIRSHKTVASFMYWIGYYGYLWNRLASTYSNSFTLTAGPCYMVHIDSLADTETYNVHLGPHPCPIGHRDYGRTKCWAYTTLDGKHDITFISGDSTLEDTTYEDMSHTHIDHTPTDSRLQLECSIFVSPKTSQTLITRGDVRVIDTIDLATLPLTGPLYHQRNNRSLSPSSFPIINEFDFHHHHPPTTHHW